MNKTSSKKCFVIMPFSNTKTHNQNYWTNHYENKYSTEIKECKF